jgi:hypothetical protein
VAILTVALLAVALLAPAWSPTAAAPPSQTVYTVNEDLPAFYSGLDNPCTPEVEQISLSGHWVIEGTVKKKNGLIQADLKLSSNFTGTDTLGRTYTAIWQSKVWGTVPADDVPPFSAVSRVVNSNGDFWLWALFKLNPNGNPTGNNSDGMVTFSPTPLDPTGSNGLDRLSCVS